MSVCDLQYLAASSPIVAVHLAPRLQAQPRATKGTFAMMASSSCTKMQLPRRCWATTLALALSRASASFVVSETSGDMAIGSSTSRSSRATMLTPSICARARTNAEPTVNKSIRSFHTTNTTATTIPNKQMADAARCDVFRGGTERGRSAQVVESRGQTAPRCTRPRAQAQVAIGRRGAHTRWRFGPRHARGIAVVADGDAQASVAKRSQPARGRTLYKKMSVPNCGPASSLISADPATAKMAATRSTTNEIHRKASLVLECVDTASGAVDWRRSSSSSSWWRRRRRRLPLPPLDRGGAAPRPDAKVLATPHTGKRQPRRMAACRCAFRGTPRWQISNPQKSDKRPRRRTMRPRSRDLEGGDPTSLFLVCMTHRVAKRRQATLYRPPPRAQSRACQRRLVVRCARLATPGAKSITAPKGKACKNHEPVFCPPREGAQWRTPHNRYAHGGRHQNRVLYIIRHRGGLMVHPRLASWLLAGDA